MNTEALLTLIADLYAQLSRAHQELVKAQQRIAELEAEAGAKASDT